MKQNKRFQNEKVTKKQFVSMYGSLIGLLLLVVVISVLRPRFISAANLRNGIDLSGGAVMGCAGMYSAYFAQAAKGYPPIVAVLIGLLIGLGFGLFNGWIIAYLKVPAFVGTLGSMSIASGLTFLLTDAKPIPNLSEGFKKMGGGNLGMIPIPIMMMSVVLLVCFALLYKTRYGRYIFAVGGNLNAAHVSGIDTKKIIGSVYVIAGVLSAFAGIITTARVTSGVTSTGKGYETDAIAAVVIGGTSLTGGKGRLWGTIVGILIMQFLSNGLDMLGVNAYYQLLVKGFVVIGAVMLDGLSQD